MGEPQTLWKRIGLTPGKAILMAVLAMALGIVIVMQYDRYRDSEALAVAPEAFALEPPGSHRRAPRAAQQLAAEIPDTAARLAMTAAFDSSKWKSPELATVVAYDPFALPQSFPRPPRAADDPQAVADRDAESTDAASDATKLAEAVEALRMELAALQERGVHVIVRERDEYAAMIGDRTVHVGDEINGFTVTAIEPDGVRVERKIEE